MTDVSSAVPSRCKFREDVLKTIAEEGIKSNEEFEEKQKMLYKTIAKYMKK